jgi:GTP-binding protein EngB required for normal cell division
VADALERLAGVARELGESGIEEDARALSHRIAANRFFLACVGQFKRGKSTLLNALLGRAILPTGVVPVTSAITVVAYGEEPAARVRFDRGAVLPIALNVIASYVSEGGNPGNAKGVRAVEVALPAPVLEGGLCLVDTPGIGSVFEANTAATREFVPHIDACLVVLGADPPISGDEMALVEEVAAETSQLVFVLNKADRLAPHERAEACEFARAVLAARLGRPVDRIFEVSATQALDGGGGAAWDALVNRLGILTAERDRFMPDRIVHRGQALRRRLLAAIRQRRDALTRPAAESGHRVAELRALVADAERSISDLTALFTAGETRLVHALDRMKEEFLERAHADAAGRLEKALTTLDAAGDPRPRALDRARAVANDSIAAWGPRMERDAEALFERAMGRFVDLAGEFLEKLATGEHSELEHLAGAVTHDPRLDAKARFYFTDLLAAAAVGPGTWVAGRVLPASRRRQRAHREARLYLDRLLDTNAARFANDLIERVRESRRDLEADIRRLLIEVVHQAEAAVDGAQRARAAGDDAVRTELERLARLEAESGRAE